MLWSVDVQPCDILHARRASAGGDPVARAVRRQLGRPHKGDDYILCNGLQVLFGEHYVSLPICVVERLDRFEDGETVEPFAFSLELPDSLSLDVARGVVLVLSSSKGRKASTGLVPLARVLSGTAYDVAAYERAA